MAGETCFEKVEHAIAATVEPLTFPGAVLQGWTVEVSRSSDDACLPDRDAIVIASKSIDLDQGDEQGQSIVRQVFEIEFITSGEPAAVLRPKNLRAAAALHAALSDDRSLGGRLQDLQEIDIVPADTSGRDAAAASVQYEATYYTPRHDWLTIVGLGGALF